MLYRAPSILLDLFIFITGNRQIVTPYLIHSVTYYDYAITVVLRDMKDLFLIWPGTYCYTHITTLQNLIQWRTIFLLEAVLACAKVIPVLSYCCASPRGHTRNLHLCTNSQSRCIDWPVLSPRFISPLSVTALWAACSLVLGANALIHYAIRSHIPRHISWCLEAARLDDTTSISLWNLSNGSLAVRLQDDYIALCMKSTQFMFLPEVVHVCNTKWTKSCCFVPSHCDMNMQNLILFTICLMRQFAPNRKCALVLQCHMNIFSIKFLGQKSYS